MSRYQENRIYSVLVGENENDVMFEKRQLRLPDIISSRLVRLLMPVCRRAGLRGRGKANYRGEKC